MVKNAPQWDIWYYVAEDKTKPFEGFIEKLKTKEEQKTCSSLIEFLRLRGDKLYDLQHLTYTEGLRLPLHEIREGRVRIFFICDGDLVVVIDGLLPTQGEEFFLEIYRRAKDYANHD
jgi:hypothetical protein